MSLYCACVTAADDGSTSSSSGDDGPLLLTSADNKSNAHLPTTLIIGIACASAGLVAAISVFGYVLFRGRRVEQAVTAAVGPAKPRGKDAVSAEDVFKGERAVCMSCAGVCLLCCVRAVLYRAVWAVWALWALWQHPKP